MWKKQFRGVSCILGYSSQSLQPENKIQISLALRYYLAAETNVNWCTALAIEYLLNKVFEHVKNIVISYSTAIPVTFAASVFVVDVFDNCENILRYDRRIRISAKPKNLP